MRDEDNAQEYVQAWYDAHKLWEMDTQEKIDNLAQMVLSAILAEREACAKICDPGDLDPSAENPWAEQCRKNAMMIRARSNVLESPNKAVGDDFPFRRHVSRGLR